MGVSTEAATGWTSLISAHPQLIKFKCSGQRLLSKVYKVEQQREGNLQAGGQQGGLKAVGTSQEQA